MKDDKKNTPKKNHKKLSVRGSGVNAYGQPDRKISVFLRLPFVKQSTIHDKLRNLNPDIDG